MTQVAQGKNAQIERQILSALLNYQETSNNVSQLKGYHFSPVHQVVFDAICWLHDNRAPIDFVTVTDRLNRTGDLEKIGGHETVTDLLTVVSNPASIAKHIEVLRERQKRLKNDRQ